LIVLSVKNGEIIACNIGYVNRGDGNYF